MGNTDLDSASEDWGSVRVSWSRGVPSKPLLLWPPGCTVCMGKRTSSWSLCHSREPPWTPGEYQRCEVRVPDGAPPIPQWGQMWAVGGEAFQQLVQTLLAPDGDLGWVWAWEQPLPMPVPVPPAPPVQVCFPAGPGAGHLCVAGRPGHAE